MAEDNKKGGLFDRILPGREKLGEKLADATRKNLNALLDAVEEFEERGGLSAMVDPDNPAARALFGVADYDGKTLRQYYANLETPYGADLEEVKRNYRRLMRKYHPDRHSGDPEREQLATQISQELTRAYQVIGDHLKRTQRPQS